MSSYQGDLDATEMPQAQLEEQACLEQPQQLDERTITTVPSAVEQEEAPEPQEKAVDHDEQQPAAAAEEQQAPATPLAVASAAADEVRVQQPQQAQEAVCGAGGKHPHHQTHPSSRPSKGSLTFSAPPYVPKAKPYPRADFSHSSVKLMKIAHDNQLLVQRLMSISRQEPAWSKDLDHHTAPCNIASSAINRCKQATTIAQENHALYQRLVAIRPSKDISRDVLEAEHRRNEVYRTNCAKQHKQAAHAATTD